jgi:hypothetical protein
VKLQELDYDINIILSRMPLFNMARKGDSIHDGTVKIFSLSSFLYLLFWY